MPRPSVTEDVFRAVADPTRRAVLETLMGAHDVPVTELADRLGVGLPMLSRHLAVLRAAGLVSERRSGRRRLYSLRPEPLHDLYDWAALFSGFWSERMQGLRSYLDRQASSDTAGPPPTQEPDDET
ncbi:ArsR/SmtB family transcription factor [Nonomuraea jiangxiensis]|uniref:DNA-binding transcriptional regulator, ArsR family n=1 Tax=Nonomuraea jiangxiensis TaxID=633440 RepID=A0A1G9TMD0_9ACTN|nr:metalloregulator ArsR/SmtB family transcription factor [Nonomuraea jiangxiensis]SDM48830.1 DNA-binding transcriptional regulator, ArsR family [Nonomuraea jiangxiensis]